MIKKYELHILLFMTNAIAMILELVAARILSPYYGSSNFVWTIIISIMLLANAFGNYCGGKLADKKDLNKIKIILMLISTFSVAFIALINDYLLTISNSTITAVIVIALFLVPCTAIGMFSPIINKAVLSGENIGNESGVIYTVITIGSLLGTVFGGLVLIPHFGCNSILYALAAFLGLYTLVYIICLKYSFKYILSSVIALALIAVNMSQINETAASNNITIIDTDESHVRIFESTDIDGENIRYFTVAGGFESAMYTDPAKQNELVFEYQKAYNAIFDKSDADKLCMLGGAGYNYPRYIVSHYADKSIDVVEIDGGVTEAAKKYFGLQDFIRQYGTERLGLYTDDARIYLAQTDKKYDAVLNDTFTGKVPARSLATQEAVKTVKSALTDNGLYAMNLIGDPYTYRSEFFNSEIKTVGSVFKYIWLQKAEGENYNWILIASDYDYGFDTESVDITADSIIFTDDYCPVEYLSEK